MLKHQATSRKKKDKPSKPALSADELEVLSHLPAILPKPSAVASPSLSDPPHLPQCVKPCVSRTMNSTTERPKIVSKLPQMGQNQGGVTVTVPLQNALETSMGSPSAPKMASIGSTQGKVIITLPPAVPPQLSSHPGPAVASNVSVQGGLILTLPPPPVHNTFICPTSIIKTSASIPLEKGHVSQRHGCTKPCVKEVAMVVPNQYQPISQKPQFILLPPGCVFASNSQMTKPRQIVLAPKSTAVEQNRKERTPDIVNRKGKPQEGPPSIQETATATDCLEETAEEELASDGVEMENEVEECDGRDLFLTLSESSGSPTPSVDENNDMEMVLQRKGMDEDKQEEEPSVSEVVLQVF